MRDGELFKISSLQGDITIWKQHSLRTIDKGMGLHIPRRKAARHTLECHCFGLGSDIVVSRHLVPTNFHLPKLLAWDVDNTSCQDGLYNIELLRLEDQTIGSFCPRETCIHSP